MNVTVVAPAADGRLQVFPSGAPVPDTSTINYVVGQTRANNAIVSLGPDGAFAVYVHQPRGATHLVVDVAGYFGTSDCSSAPAPPLLAFDGGARTLSWAAVPGATSYDLYVREEPGQCGLLRDVTVTRSDQRIPGVTSPFDISAFDKCGTCTFVDIVAKEADCESPLQSDFGSPAPVSFSLLPCTP